MLQLIAAVGMVIMLCTIIAAGIAGVLHKLNVPWCSGLFLEDRTMWRYRHHPAITEAELVHNMMLLYPNVTLHSYVADNLKDINAMRCYSIPMPLRRQYPVLCNILHALHKNRCPDSGLICRWTQAINDAREHYRRLYMQYQRAQCGTTYLGVLCADLQDTITLNMAQFIKGPPAHIKVLGQEYMHNQYPAYFKAKGNIVRLTYTSPYGQLEFHPGGCTYTTTDERYRTLIVTHNYSQMTAADRATFANLKLAGHNFYDFVNKHA